MNADRSILIRKAKNGDMDAFAEVFEDLRPTVFRFVHRMVGANDAGDVVMDAFIKAWRGMPGFDERSSLKTWLFRIAYRCAIDFLRSSRHGKERPLGDFAGENGMPEDAVADTRKLPDEIAVEKDDAELVASALRQLSGEHQTALALRYIDGLRYGEIAAVTGVSIGTVMSRLFNGKRKLRKLIESKMGG